MEKNGSCHCGDIQFLAEVSDEVIVCHCEDCQVLSGSPYRVTLKTKAASFNLLRGELKFYGKTADSGDVRVQAFCPSCGTPIYSSVDVKPEFLFIRLGALKTRKEIRPTSQIWKRSELCNFRNIVNVTGSSEQQALTSK